MISNNNVVPTYFHRYALEIKKNNPHEKEMAIKWLLPSGRKSEGVSFSEGLN